MNNPFPYIAVNDLGDVLICWMIDNRGSLREEVYGTLRDKWGALVTEGKTRLVSTAPLRDDFDEVPPFDVGLDILFDESLFLSSIPNNPQKFILKWGDDHQWEGDAEDQLGGLVDLNFPRKHGVQSIAINPANIFTGTYEGGVFKSSDFGQSWEQEIDGFWMYEDWQIGYTRVISSIVIRPSNPSEIYAGSEGSVFSSTDAGEHWTQRDIVAGLVDSISALAISEDSYLIAGTMAHGIYRSNNWGDSWNHVWINSDSIFSMEVSESEPSVVFAGIEWGTLLKSIDGGASWSYRSTTGGGRTYDVSVSLSDPSIVYAGTGDDPYFPTYNGVYKSTNRGDDWSQKSNGIPVGTTIRSVEISSTNENIVYAGTWGLGLYKSTNGGDNWIQKNTGLGDLNVMEIAIDPSDDNVIYAGTRNGGIYKSTNGGELWYLTSTGLSLFLSDAFHVDTNGFPEDPYVQTGPGNVIVDYSGRPIFFYFEHNTWYTQRFDEKLIPLGGKFEAFPVNVEVVGFHGASASPNNNYVIAYSPTGNTELRLIGYNSDDVQQFDVRINYNTTFYYYPLGSQVEVFKKVATFKSDPFEDYIVVVWVGRLIDVPQELGIWARVFDPTGNPVTSEFKVSDPQHVVLPSTLIYPTVATSTNSRFMPVWRDERDPTRKDLYGSLWALDAVVPSISNVDDNLPPPNAAIFESSGTVTTVTADVEDLDAILDSGVESVYLVYDLTGPWGATYPRDSVAMTLTPPFTYGADLPMPYSPGSVIEYFVRAKDGAQNAGRSPADEGIEIDVRELGDINGDGCLTNVDLSRLYQIIFQGADATPVEIFFADVDQVNGVNEADYEALEAIINEFPYINCIAWAPTGPPLELAAVYGAPGETDVLVPVYLDNDSSEVSTVDLLFEYDPSIFTIPTLEQTSRSQGVPYYIDSPINQKRVGLFGNDSTYVAPGEGAILKLEFDVATDAPEGRYHFNILRVAATDTMGKDLLVQPLRGKFFIPEPPPVSLICTPLSDTTISPGDSLRFNTTVTNHSDSTMSPKFFIYGTTTGPDSFTFLAVDTTQIMMLSPGDRKRDITDLEVPTNAPLGHYIFTAYVVSPVTDSTFDDDSFGFHLDGQNAPGRGGSQLASSGMEPWRVLRGWFGYNERKGAGERNEVATSPHPRSFAISQNYPNPFNPSTTISYAVPAGEEQVNVRISIYNLRGQLVKVLVNESQSPGLYSIHWNGTDQQGIKVSSGTYLYQIHAGDFTSTRKMVVLE